MGVTGNAGQTMLRQLIYESVRDITELKRGRTEPCVAHISEILNSINIELTECLRELCREGVLSVNINVNKQPMFQITKPIKP